VKADKAAIQSRNGRLSDSRIQRFSNTRVHASVLTDLGVGKGTGLAAKPKQVRPSMRITSMAGSTLDLKPSKRQA
jgi:hypothetical protein